MVQFYAVGMFWFDFLICFSLICSHCFVSRRMLSGMVFILGSLCSQIFWFRNYRGLGPQFPQTFGLENAFGVKVCRYVLFLGDIWLCL